MRKTLKLVLWILFIVNVLSGAFWTTMEIIGSVHPSDNRNLWYAFATMVNLGFLAVVYFIENNTNTLDK